MDSRSRTFKSQLRQRLWNKSKDLYKRYEVLWQFTVDNFLKYMNTENFTNHGEDHALNVEKNISRLMTEAAKEKLNAFDLFCLLCASCLHDIGTIFRKGPKEKYVEIRKDHHIRTKELLEQNYLEYQLNQNEGQIIGKICYGHGTPDLNEFQDEWSVDPFGRVPEKFLAALLRIGDLIDLSYLRAPKLVVALKKITGVSLRHWNLHSRISDIQIDHKNKKLEIFAAAKNEYDLSELYRLRNWIQAELNIVKEAFEKFGIFLDEVFLCTDLDRNKILPKENPFIKLESFDWSKHMAFFGRDVEIKKLCENIMGGNLVVLVGESGVGKTSLLNAGLKQVLIEKGFDVFEIRISENFQEDLFKRVKTQFPEFKSRNIFELFEKISDENFDIVVFLDQFEEIFTLSRQDLKSRILGFLKDILSNNKIGLKMILSLREDFFAELWQVSCDYEIPQLFNRENTFRLKKLNKENAKQAIINTILHIDYRIDYDLVEELLEDFTRQETEDAIYPPYLQIVCYEIFEHHKKTYKDKSDVTPLNLTVYERLGRAEKIVVEYFEEILSGFTIIERSVINEILSRMITYFHTKQRISFEQILAINDSRIDIDSALNRLIRHRIIKKIETEKDEYELIHDFLAKKIIEREPFKSVSGKIRKAIDYIRGNIERQITLQEVADSVDFSREHFCRLFKSETESNFIEYVNNERIKKSIIYLKNPTLKIRDISKQVGFLSPQHFTNTFKKIKGCTPSEYRKKNLKL